MTKASRLSSPARIILILAVIFFLLAGLWHLSGTQLARGLTQGGINAASPILRLRAQALAPLGKVRAYLDSKESLTAENERLRDELLLAKSSLVTLKQLEREKEKLEQLLARPVTNETTRIARVIADETLSASDSILVDVGTAAPNQLVTEGGLILIGQVAEVARSTSKVRLYSSPGVTAIAQIGESAESVKVEGRGGGNMYARVPNGFSVQVGDQARVLVAGRTYILGVVEEIKSSDTDPFQELFIALPSHLNLGDYVLIHQHLNEPDL